MFVSENSHDKLVACTIIPFCEANLSDHLAMKLTMDLVIATPHMLKITAIHLDRAFPKLTYLRLSTETNTLGGNTLNIIS